MIWTEISQAHAGLGIDPVGLCDVSRTLHFSPIVFYLYGVLVSTDVMIL